MTRAVVHLLGTCAMCMWAGWSILGGAILLSAPSLLYGFVAALLIVPATVGALILVIQAYQMGLDQLKEDR